MQHNPRSIQISPVLLLGLCITAVLFPVPVLQAQSYTVTDLGTFSGGSVSQGQSVSECGQVVGYARFADFNAHAFLWNHDDGLQDIGAIAPPSNFSVAEAINSKGVVAGYSTFNYPPDLNSHAVLWADGQLQDLGTLPNSNDAQAMAVNNRGEVVGFSVPHAFRWTSQSGMKDLGALPGGYSQALAINSRGEVVGFSDNARGNWQGFIWTRSQGMQALPYLYAIDDNASANGINRKGQIVGASGHDFGSTAVLWNQPDHVAESLGVLPDQGWSVAFAINNRGEVVGWSGFRAFLWSRDSGIRDLNNLIPNDSGWLLSLPTAINNRGQITGQGTINGEQHAFLLTPTSEDQAQDCK